MTRNLGHLEIKLFRFNHSVDYLPYYRTYKIEYTKEDCIYDILNKINDIETFSYEELDKCNLNINNYFVKANILVSALVEKTGTDIVIEPISLYRATKDLLINSKDYDQKLELFDDYLDDSQKVLFQEKYKLEYYASLTMILNKDYIGDHSLMIADEIISKNPDLEKKILKIITNKDIGILYHTSLENRLFSEENSIEEVYEKLLSKIKEYKKVQKKELKECELLTKDISQYFKGFNIALYGENSTCYEETIKNSRASYIKLDSQKYDLAINSKIVNEDFTLRIAGEILLEAKDKNADFIIVNCEDELKIFDAMQSKMENVVNREIQLPVLTQSQFNLLLQGEKSPNKLAFSKHKVKVSLLDK